MSIFAKLVTKVLPVPGEEGQTITIRKLAPKHFEAVTKASRDRAMERMKELSASLGGELQNLVPILLKEHSDKPATSDQSSETAVEPKPISTPDPLAVYDRVALMVHGVSDWTYDLERTQENFEEVDDDTQDWLAREILKLSKPNLFVASVEAEQKND